MAKLSGGPALAVVGGSVQYYVVGSNNRLYENTGSPGAYSQIGSYACVGAPAVSVAGTSVYLACNSLRTHAVLYARNSNGGQPTGWPASATSLGGVIQGAPAIVARDATLYAGAVAVFAVGTNGYLYKRNVIQNGGWTLQGGPGLRGVGATHLPT